MSPGVTGAPSGPLILPGVQLDPPEAARVQREVPGAQLDPLVRLGLLLLPVEPGEVWWAS